VAAIDHALSREDKTLAIFALRDPQNDNPGLENLYAVGTSSTVRLLARADDTVQVFLRRPSASKSPISFPG